MNNVFSHPGVPLIEHLTSVAEIGIRHYKRTPPLFSFVDNPEIIKNIIYLTLICHDIGKATTFFQKYLASGGNEGRGRLKEHAHISAMLGCYWTKELLEKNEDSYSDTTLHLLPVISFQSILRHHGQLHNTNDELIPDKPKKKVLKQQYEDMKPFIECFHHFLKENSSVLSIPKDFENLWQAVYDDDEIDWFEEDLKEECISLEYAIFELYLFSLLVEADKTHAIFRESFSNIEYSPSTISPQIIEDFIDNNLKDEHSTLDILRNDILKNVSETAENVPLENRILSLKIPTGCGKTLTALKAAILIGNRVYHKSGNFPQIIYCLPFTSIIDQNFAVYKKVFENQNSSESIKLLKHHHLCDYSQDSSNMESEDENQDFISKKSDNQKFLAEGWNGNIVVTTLYQLLHSIYQNHNRPLRKFHRYVGSIFLIDEVQAIPQKYFALIRETFNVMSRIFSSYFIFISATQPCIFPDNEITSLISNEEKIYKKDLSDRVTLNIMTGSEVENIEHLKLWYDENVTSGSTMFVMNTIKSAKRLSQLFIDDNLNIEFLSSHIIPRERLNRINNLKNELRTGKPIVLITTQIVEAGVDVDFDRVVRDFAPWDSIMQASGRCNRHGDKKMGKVYLFRLKDKNKPYSSYVYDSTLLNITEIILKKYGSIPENLFFDLSEQYYHEIQKKMSQHIGRQILDQFRQFRFKDVSWEFKLIDQIYDRQDIFIPVNDKATDLWQEYEEIFSDSDMSNFEKKKKFDSIKSEFMQYIIAVPSKTLNWHIGEDKPIILLPSDRLSDYYDPLTGYSPGDREFNIII